MILAAFGDQPDPELRKPIWQPGGALYYWHRSLQPAKDGETPNLAKMQPWEKQIYDIFNDRRQHHRRGPAQGAVRPLAKPVRPEPAGDADCQA